MPRKLVERGIAAAAGASAAAWRLLPPRASSVVTCPVCANAGSPYVPNPFKTWANAGRDDDGTPLRRCRRCGAEVEITLPLAGLTWWRAPEVRLVSREPRFGKGRARRRRRRAAARGRP